MTPEFLDRLRRSTEAYWALKTLNPSIYGFQILPGTRWLPGLTRSQIDTYQQDLGVVFPADFRLYLSRMNGTDLETLNIYGSSAEPHRKGPGIYSYPRDLERVRSIMRDWEEDWVEISAELSLEEGDRCVPIFAHRGVLCSKDGRGGKVLSIVGTDAIVYGEDLESYLEREFGSPAKPGT